MFKNLLASFVVLFVTALMLAVFPSSSMAKANSKYAVGQLMVMPGSPFAEKTMSDGLTISGFAQGVAIVDTTGFLQIFGYMGPRLAFKDTELMALGGAYLTTDGGCSGLMSVMFLQKVLFWERLGLFVQADVYFPVETSGVGKHTDMQIFLYGEMMIQATELFSIGLATEHFLTENGDAHVEAAVGPMLKIGKFGLWPAWDFAPDGNKGQFILRVVVPGI